MGDDRERGIVGMLRQAQQRFPKLLCRVQLRPYHIKPPLPKQDWDKLWRTHLLTQRACLGVGVLHLGCSCPLVISRAAPRAMCRVTACWVCADVSGSVFSSSMPVVKWLTASRSAERSLA